MPIDSLDRRTLLGLGIGISALGSISYYAISSSTNETSPGALGLSGSLVPNVSGGISQIRFGQIDEPLHRIVTPYNSIILSDRLLHTTYRLLEAIVSRHGARSIGKIVILQSGTDRSCGGVLLWANVPKSQFVPILKAIAGGLRGENEQRNIHEFETFSASIITDNVFAFGGLPMVKQIHEVWQGDGEPLKGSILHLLERTPTSAPIRFVTAAHLSDDSHKVHNHLSQIDYLFGFQNPGNSIHSTTVGFYLNPAGADGERRATSTTHTRTTNRRGIENWLKRTVRTENIRDTQISHDPTAITIKHRGGTESSKRFIRSVLGPFELRSKENQ